GLAPTARDALAPLAPPLPALGPAPTTPVAERPARRRPRRPRVLGRSRGERARRHLTSAWGGGGPPAGRTPRPLRRPAPWRTAPWLGARLRRRAAAGASPVHSTACRAQADGCAPQPDRV